MSPDKTLSELFLKIAQSYEALAENEEWLDGKRSPVIGLRCVGAHATARAADGGPC
jgi:hypothetical protein